MKSLKEKKYAVVQLGYGPYSDAFGTIDKAIDDAHEWLDEPKRDIPKFYYRGFFEGDIVIISSDYDEFYDYIDENGMAKI